MRPFHPATLGFVLFAVALGCGSAHAQAITLLFYDLQSRADQLLDDRRYAEGAAVCTQGIQLFPNRSHFWSERALMTLYRGMPSVALSDIRQAILIDDGYSGVNLAICEYWCAMRRYDLAIKCATECIKTSPDWSDYHDARGQILATLGKTRAGFDEIKVSIKLLGRDRGVEQYRRRFVELAAIAYGIDKKLAVHQAKIAASKYSPGMFGWYESAIIAIEALRDLKEDAEADKLLTIAIKSSDKRHAGLALLRYLRHDLEVKNLITLTVLDDRSDPDNMHFEEIQAHSLVAVELLRAGQRSEAEKHALQARRLEKFPLCLYPNCFQDVVLKPVPPDARDPEVIAKTRNDNSQTLFELRKGSREAESGRKARKGEPRSKDGSAAPPVMPDAAPKTKPTPEIRDD